MRLFLELYPRGTKIIYPFGGRRFWVWLPRLGTGVGKKLLSSRKSKVKYDKFIKHFQTVAQLDSPE
jgi:hypothetical protein